MTPKELGILRNVVYHLSKFTEAAACVDCHAPQGEEHKEQCRAIDDEEAAHKLLKEYHVASGL